MTALLIAWDEVIRWIRKTEIVLYSSVKICEIPHSSGQDLPKAKISSDYLLVDKLHQKYLITVYA